MGGEGKKRQKKNACMHARALCVKKNAYEVLFFLGPNPKGLTTTRSQNKPTLARNAAAPLFRIEREEQKTEIRTTIPKSGPRLAN